MLVVARPGKFSERLHGRSDRPPFDYLHDLDHDLDLSGQIYS